jgi:ABC-type dipeptide/oligopeptide/nickel transport system permease component
MLEYLTKRILQSLVVLLLLTFIVFTIINLSGDPVRLLLPPDATAEDVQALRTAWGLDDPLLIRYGRFIGRVVQLDFGRSLQLRQPALGLVMERLPTTLGLAGLAVFVSTLISVPAGVLAATQRGRVLDGLVSSLALIGQSTPVFWLGIMSILLFAVRLGWLPASGQSSPRHWILPVSTLSLFLAGGIVRVTRTSVLEILPEPFVRTAKAKGSTPATVIWKHVVRNAAIPIVTQIGLQLRFVIGGSVITESVFALPGLGRLLVRSVFARDYPIVVAGVFVTAALLIAINILIDVSYTRLNPKVSLR